MNRNDDFSVRVLVHSPLEPWIDSPIKGVRRRPMDRIGAEVSRATTIVSYEPGSRFSAHVHTGGEEFVVLDGVFQDEHGDYPVGSYIRNPPQSSHTPGSADGCVIFVKLWQFDPADRSPVCINISELESSAEAGRDGVHATTLYADQREHVRFEHWDANAAVTVDTSGGAELLVLQGSFSESGDELSRHSWLRLPPGADFAAQAGEQGCQVWVKTGHLRFVEEERARLPI